MWRHLARASKIAIELQEPLVPVTLTRTLGIGLLVASLAAPHALAQPASTDVQHLVKWVRHAHDNQGLPFLIVDKVHAQVFAFYANGRLRGASAALLGLAIGDDSVPGIGDRKLAHILPQERTTPAGRFVANLDRNLSGEEILWIDYASAISLHPVITNDVKERRAERLATPSALDNRISYGCINVPADFFRRVVRAAFKHSNGIVYVLPETRSPQKVFMSYDVDEQSPLEPTATDPTQNQILSMLPNLGAKRLQSDLELVAMPLGWTMSESGDRVK